MNPPNGPAKGPSVQWNMNFDPTKVQLKSTSLRKTANPPAKEAAKTSFLSSEVSPGAPTLKPVLKRFSQGPNDSPVAPKSAPKVKAPLNNQGLKANTVKSIPPKGKLDKEPILNKIDSASKVITTPLETNKKDQSLPLSQNAQSLLELKLDNPKQPLNADQSIDLVTECIRLGELEAQNASGKDLIVLIGNTGAGKSTFVNYLYGCEMEGKTPKELGIKGLHGKLIMVKPESRPSEIMKIGHTKKSMTFMPKIATDERGRTYCDCPGFLDNRGFEINIANAVNIRNVLINALNVKVVILINYHSLQADRARGLTDMIDICVNLFGSKENLIQFKDSIRLGITQLKTLSPDDEALELEDLKSWLCETEMEDDFDKTVLNVLANRLFIFDPLDRTNLCYKGSWSREEILSDIANLPPIQDPSKIFKTVLNAEDQKGLEFIAGEFQERIAKIFSSPSLTEQDYKKVALFFSSLTKLDIIANPYVTKLIGKAKLDIINCLNKKVSRFEVCCAEATPVCREEAQTILQELRSGLIHFDSEIQEIVNIASLEKRLTRLLKKVAAEAEALALQDMEKRFRDFCHTTNFLEAKELLESLEEKVRSFEREYSDTNIPHHVETGALRQLYDIKKKQNDQDLRLKLDQQEQIRRLEEEQRRYQDQLEDQRLREDELRQDNERIAQEAREAQAKLEKRKNKTKAQKNKLTIFANELNDEEPNFFQIDPMSEIKSRPDFKELQAKAWHKRLFSLPQVNDPFPYLSHNYLFQGIVNRPFFSENYRILANHPNVETIILLVPKLGHHSQFGSNHVQAGIQSPYPDRVYKRFTRLEIVKLFLIFSDIELFGRSNVEEHTELADRIVSDIEEFYNNPDNYN